MYRASVMLAWEMMPGELSQYLDDDHPKMIVTSVQFGETNL